MRVYTWILNGNNISCTLLAQVVNPKIIKRLQVSNFIEFVLLRSESKQTPNKFQTTVLGILPSLE